MSLADIAARIGIHKSALLRYFETREQISPALAQACVDLAPRLRRTAEILLAGLIPSRNKA